MRSHLLWAVLSADLFVPIDSKLKVLDKANHINCDLNYKMFFSLIRWFLNGDN
jgi:hypothetical protein